MNAEKQSKNKTKKIVLNGILIALVFVATMFINIRLPLPGNGGLIHFGNVPLFIAALIYGKKTGAVAGAFGMSLFDLVMGWTIWAPFTFVIVGAMGYSMGLIKEKMQGNAFLINCLAVIVALAIKIAGYYITELMLYGNWMIPLGSIPGNVMQIVLAAVVVLPFVEKIKKLSTLSAI